MRSLLLLTAISATLPAASVTIDHVTVAGNDLKKMQAALGTVGITTVYGGAHTNGSTEMALVSFPDGSYLELIGIQPNADRKAIEEHVWARFLTNNGGPCAWAVREKNLAAEIKRLEAAGVPVGAPVKSGRERPDGVRLEWETSDVGKGPRGTFFPFIIQDLTPREKRAFPQGKPGNRDFRGVSKVVIAVRDLEDGIARYRQAYGVPPPIKQVDKNFGAYLALLGDVPVILAQPLTADNWLSERLERFGEAPAAFILEASRPGRYKTASSTRWFGMEVSWFDPSAVGWRLGFEPE